MELALCVWDRIPVLTALVEKGAEWLVTEGQGHICEVQLGNSIVLQTSECMDRNHHGGYDTSGQCNVTDHPCIHWPSTKMPS